MNTRADQPDPPRFETLDACPVTRRMQVNSRKPPVRLSTSGPIDGYDWDLSQDGALVESARDVTTGITDGTCIQFTPTTPLRRGPVEDARLPEGYFLPPFGTRWSYRTSTYAGHSDFAVDFNRGGPGADEGDWVTAPAPGIVAYLDVRAPGTDGPEDPGVSDLLIDHAGGFRTLYSHMRDIPRAVRVGAPIELRQRLGRISDLGTTTGSHLHHGHFGGSEAARAASACPSRCGSRTCRWRPASGTPRRATRRAGSCRVSVCVARSCAPCSGSACRGRRTARGGASFASPSPRRAMQRRTASIPAVRRHPEARACPRRRLPAVRLCRRGQLAVDDDAPDIDRALVHRSDLLPDDPGPFVGTLSDEDRRELDAGTRPRSQPREPARPWTGRPHRPARRPDGWCEQATAFGDSAVAS